MPSKHMLIDFILFPMTTVPTIRDPHHPDDEALMRTHRTCYKCPAINTVRVYEYTSPVNTHISSACCCMTGSDAQQQQTVCTMILREASR